MPVVVRDRSSVAECEQANDGLKLYVRALVRRYGCYGATVACHPVCGTTGGTGVIFVAWSFTARVVARQNNPEAAVKAAQRSRTQPCTTHR